MRTDTEMMTNDHPAFKRLLDLLEREFELPKGGTEFTLECKHDDVPRITVSYVPQGKG